MPTIIPHLWFDKEAVEAAEFYVSAIPGSRLTDVTVLPGTPSGDTEVVSFELAGQPFQAISAGPLFRFNPSVSFLVACDTVEEVDRLWTALGDGGAPLMPLGAYPFSERYGWTEDRYGLSWQVFHAGQEQISHRIVPTLMFAGAVCGKAEEAVTFYTSVFPDAGIDHIDRYTAGEEPDVAGTVRHAGFRLAGQAFAAMDSAQDPGPGFNEAISFLISCDAQEEIDRYWAGLSAVPEAEQCGWLKDRFGLSWQVAPSVLDVMLRSGTPDQVASLTEAFLAMGKLDLAELQRAYERAERQG